MKLTRRELLIRSVAAALVLPACRRPDPTETDDDPLDTDPLDTAARDTDTGEPLDTGWTFEPGPEPDAPWEPDGELDPGFAWGVQVGDALLTSAIAQVQTVAPAVSLRLAAATEAGFEEILRLDDLIPTDEVVRVELTGLLPDTTYAVCFESEAGRSGVTRFRTALYPDVPRVVRFGATSCLGSSNAPWPSLDHAAAEKLDFFVLLGDAIYADGGEGDVPWFRTFWREALGTGGLLTLTASTSLIATWDDHELDNDWDGTEDGIDRQTAALTAFRAAIPQREGENGVLWRALSWGEVLDVFVLDCRGERSGSQYISVEQLAWLKAGLSNSKARFKIIVNSVPITDWSDTVLWDWAQEDRWQGHTGDREAILSHIRDHAIGGVLWISGDHHFAAITHVDAEGGTGDGQYEVLCGPAGSSINPACWGVYENTRYPAIVRTHNWTRFECDADAGTIAVSFVDDDGDVVSTLTLKP